MTTSRILRRSAHLGALIGLAILLVLPGMASAGKPTLDPYSNGPFEFDLCGIPTSLTLVGTERNHSNGVQNQAGIDTYTNLLTGASVTGTHHSTLREVAVTDNVFGGQSFTYTISGLLMQLHDGKRVVLIDAGKMVATDAFDADGNFVSHTVLEMPGPAHGDETSFCAAYTAATS